MDFDTSRDLRTNLEVRSEIYHFLAQIFTEPPNDQVLKTISEKAFIDVIMTYFEESPLYDDFSKLYDKMTLNLETEQASKRTLSLSREFNELFMVPGSKYLIPYESQHHQESADFPGTILSKQVGFIYQKAGFILDQNNVELPDYIGNELAFAGILLKKASKKEGNHDTSVSYYQLYSEFLKDHLLMWIPVFSEKMQHKSLSVFFKVWGIFLEQFIREERDLVLT
ncbi:MAG: TorD/DmsD family molecular chaperone [Candidatus Hodarchaeales archaeon]|jgi:TorA maturation chaperone TorD